MVILKKPRFLEATNFYFFVAALSLGATQKAITIDKIKTIKGA